MSTLHTPECKLVTSAAHEDVSRINVRRENRHQIDRNQFSIFGNYVVSRPMQTARTKKSPKRIESHLYAAFLLGLILVVPGLFPGSAWAQQTTTPTKAPFDILVISSWNKALPWAASFDKGLNAGLQAMDRKTKVYVEYLDAARFKEGNQQNVFELYLRGKYAGKPIGVVVT